MKRIVGQHTYTRPITELVCDRCGQTYVESEGWSVHRFQMSMERGDVFPEGVFTETHGIHCCDVCWPVFVVAVRDAGFEFWHTDSSGETIAPNPEWDQE